MKTPEQKKTDKTIKTIRKATAVYIYTVRKASKSQWFPDIKSSETVKETLADCMEAIDEANRKFIA